MIFFIKCIILLCATYTSTQELTIPELFQEVSNEECAKTQDNRQQGCVGLIPWPNQFIFSLVGTVAKVTVAVGDQWC